MRRLRANPAPHGARGTRRVRCGSTLATGLLTVAALVPAALALGGSAAPVAAQEPPPRQERPDTAPPDPIRIAPLTVSVLRDVAPLTSTPYAVAGADAEDLRLGRSGAFLEEALALLPGVQVQNRYNFAVGERLAVRGFGPRAQFGVRGVQVLVDGIPATMPDGQTTLDHLDLASIGRAEVLRGPGSALYGNAAGGVLLLETEAPRTGPVRPDTRFVVGSDGLVNGSGGASGRVGDAALVAKLSVLRYDGFRTNPNAVDEAYGEAERALFNGQLTRPLADGLLQVTLNGVTLDAENPGSLPATSLDDDDRPAWGFNVAQRTRKELDQAQLGVGWKGPVAGGGADIALWGLGRSVLNPIPTSVIDLSRRAGGVRGLWMRGEDGGFTWGAGVEAGWQDDDRLNFENDDGEPGTRTLDQNETVRALGTFVKAELEAAPRLTVSGALRYDHFRFEAEDRFVLPGSGDPDDSGTRTMDAWSPTAGVVFDAGALSVWANFATAIETPTTTELVNRPGGAGGFNPELEPVRSTSWEVGARGAVLDDAVNWEVALFRADLEDELVPFEVPEAPDRRFFRNAGASEHDGVEAAVDARLGGGVAATVVFSRTDARFDAYEVDGEDFAGNRVPGLAPHRVDAQLEQRRAGWFWAADAEWVDAIPVDDANSATAGAYWVFGVRAGLDDLRVSDLLVSPYAGVSNLFDEFYSSSVIVNAFGGRFFEPGPGRTGYVGLGLRWAP